MNRNSSTGTIVAVVIVLIIIAAGLYYYQNKSGTSAQAFGISVPQAGMVLTPGQSYMLRWNDTGTAQESTTTLAIFLINTALLSQGQSVAISDRYYDVPDVGFYLYTVPTSTLPGMYKFEIGTLTSDAFTIASSSASGSASGTPTTTP